VLLDTSFILPTLGIEVNERVLNGLKKLRDISSEIFVSRFNILEALWVSIRLIKAKKFNQKRFLMGLESIFEGKRYSFIDESYTVFKKALKFYILGHEDMIDNLLYAISLEQDLLFLTIDDELREFIRENNLKDTTVYPEEIDELL